MDYIPLSCDHCRYAIARLTAEGIQITVRHGREKHPTLITFDQIAAGLRQLAERAALDAEDGRSQPQEDAPDVPPRTLRAPRSGESHEPPGLHQDRA